MRTTTATAAKRVVSAGRIPRTICSCSSMTSALSLADASGYCVASRSEIVFISRCAVRRSRPLEARQHAEEVSAARRIRRIQRKRPPELRGAGGKVEPGRHDADDGGRLAVHRDRPADNVGIGSEGCVQAAWLITSTVTRSDQMPLKGPRSPSRLGRRSDRIGSEGAPFWRCCTRRGVEYRVLGAPVEECRGRNGESAVLRHDLVHADDDSDAG